MESTAASWARALPHREGADLDAARDRLVAAGVTADEARAALADLGDGLYRAGHATDPLRTALLWNELGAYLAYAQERAASGRRATYARLVEDASLARVAAQLGVSRQAVHKTVSTRDVEEIYVATLSLGGRQPDGD
ncbi:hypothetical protein [Puerhibacterium puerhi]|uniref:hypothetical protein n=1 Tax=Puerhibacterium puerhi TaxID=2692623 RepID=UPI00135BEE1D|nr:hypothetical protein [Puerhibacterium puerhi]